jgi:pyrroloquinoline quinone (PQQ) biosynthesis protein C
MGCTPETVRQAVWQFLKTSDPHISLLRRFADAVGITIEELVGKKKGRST